jgi:NAD(P)-dependent dehydrogenase (short-subunit alcohol dehydrogenase family)
MNMKVYMVTGVTSGLGKAIALELAKTGETVILVARDPQRAAQVEKEISAATQNPNLDVQICDLSNLSSVRNLATIVNSRYNHLDLLINNAGVYKRTRQTTLDGYETMFVTNHLGPFLLTYLLMDRLLASGSARIINITAPSTTQLDFDDLQGEKKFTSLNAFGATKTANLLFTFELARRLANTGITVNAIHPGLVKSGIMKEAFAPLRILTQLFSSPPTRAAQEVVRIATSPEFEKTTGKFLHNGQEVEPSSYSLDPANQARLWEISEALTKAPEQGPNYDPTGSIAMHNNYDIPEGLIRPKEDPTHNQSAGGERA